MNWQKAKHIEQNKFDLPGNWLNIHYFEALNILFRIENALRVFVFIILKENFQDKWKDLNVTSDDNDSSTISSISKKRIAQDNNFGYLGYSNTNPLLYLTSGELIRLITSEAYWKFFKAYFLGNKDIMKNKLDEIGNIRNSLAHFRPIKEGDVELIKQNSEHTLKLIEECIYQIIKCPDTVPTNTTEAWYLDFRTLGTEEVSFNFNQTDNSKWIKVVLNYNPQIIESYAYATNNFASYKTTKLKANKVLSEFPLLTRYLVCSIEKLGIGLFTKIENIKFNKFIEFVLPQSVLAKNHLEIKEQLEQLLIMISTENELIKKDNLARGKIIEGAKVKMHKNNESAYWRGDYDELYSKVSESDAPEFWGKIIAYHTDFISNTEYFPWLNVQISDDKELPF